jgi:hypothetical protein
MCFRRAVKLLKRLAAPRPSASKMGCVNPHRDLCEGEAKRSVEVLEGVQPTSSEYSPSHTSAARVEQFGFTLVPSPWGGVCLMATNGSLAASRANPHTPARLHRRPS